MELWSVRFWLQQTGCLLGNEHSLELVSSNFNRPRKRRKREETELKKRLPT